jgi:hypothetical protein
MGTRLGPSDRSLVSNSFAHEHCEPLSSVLEVFRSSYLELL